MKPKAFCRVLAHLLLVAGELRHRHFEILRHHALQAVTVERDELAQEGDRQQRLPALALFLEDDLGQHRAGDVVAGLGVVDDEVDLVLYHLRQMIERDVGRGGGVVEPPVGIFLDDDRGRLGPTVGCCLIGHYAALL